MDEEAKSLWAIAGRMEKASWIEPNADVDLPDFIYTPIGLSRMKAICNLGSDYEPSNVLTLLESVFGLGNSGKAGKPVFEHVEDHRQRLIHLLTELESSTFAIGEAVAMHLLIKSFCNKLKG